MIPYPVKSAVRVRVNISVDALVDAYCLEEIFEQDEVHEIWANRSSL